MTCGRSVVFSGIPVSSTKISDRHIITEILLKEALNTITLNQTPILAILLRDLDFTALKTFLTFQSFSYECTEWRIFQKRANIYYSI
jgi:hypothetical protein